MTTFAADPPDTGEICRDLTPSADRAVPGGVHREDGPTRPMAPAPVPTPLPRYQTAEHAAIEIPETIGEVTERLILPAVPPAPRVDWAVPVASSVLLPHGAHRAPAPMWAIHCVAAGTGLLIGALSVALFSLAVMW